MNFVDLIVQSFVRSLLTRAMRFDNADSPLLPTPSSPRPRLLYLHIPFCERLCPYCSFHRVPLDPPLTRAYFSAVRNELHLYRDRGYDFTGLYVGGGTPTVMVDELAKVLHLARSLFSIKEISVETNPHHLTEANVTLLQKAGVNRLSVGVQSFDDGLLRRMERYEKYGSGSEIATRLKQIRGAFPTVNADMIFNLPTQTETVLKRDLAQLMELSLDQVTYYPLMVSSSTRRRVSATLGRVTYRRERDFYRLITGTLIPHYRFSSAWCFSRTDAMIDEYIVDYDAYAGLGSGAIGYLEGTCYANTFDIPAYISRLERNELPIMAQRTFHNGDKIRYDFLMHMFGTYLDRRDLRAKYGAGWWYPLILPLAFFRLTGRITRRGSGWELTPRGYYSWVVMMREFFTAVNNFRDYCRQSTREERL